MIQLREIDHLVLRVRDIDAMRRFYCEVLGAEHVAWRPQFGMSHLRVGRSSMIDLITIDGPLGKAGGAGPQKEGRNVDHFCFRVDPFDEEAISAHLRKHGVQFEKAQRRFGAEGNGLSMYLTDPEGNMVELKGPSDGARQPPPPKT